MFKLGLLAAHIQPEPVSRSWSNCGKICLQIRKNWQTKFL